MEKIEITLPTIDQVEFETLVSEESIPIRGNAIATGNDEEDAKVENDLIDQLERGNIWAWCAVEVRATWRGITASDYLGGCSYASQNDFERGDGYYSDMKQTAYNQLLDKIRALKEKETNHFFEMLDIDKCKELIQRAKERKEIAILCPHYSINIQSKYNDSKDPEQMNWDFDDFENALDCTLSVSDYDDLIADFTETENE